MTEPAVHAQGLGQSYGTVRALDGLDLTVAAGSLTAVLGPNGAGKTTFLEQVCALRPVVEGSLRILGLDVRRASTAVRAQLGVVFQESTVDDDLSVLENLVLHGRLYGMRRAWARSRAMELLDRFGLADRAHNRIKVLSGGLARRVELVRALLHGPRLLVLDEPTSGLDPSSRVRFWSDVREQIALERMTVLFSTHYLAETDGADEIHILVAGARVASGTAEQLRATVGTGGVLLVTAEPARLSSALDEAGIRALPDDRGVLVPDDDPGSAVVRLCEFASSRGIPLARAEPAGTSMDQVFLRFLETS